MMFSSIILLKSLQLLIVLILCFWWSMPTTDGAPSVPRRKLKYCKLDHLFECFNEPINYFTAQQNGTGIAANEKQMEQFCFNNHDFLPYCAQQWTKNCASTVHGQLVEKLFIIPMKQSMFEFCNSNGTIRPKFLRNAHCLINEVKLSQTYRRKCVRKIQANFEFGHEMALKSGSIVDFVRSFCCTFNDWESCIVGELRENCGAEAAEVFPELIHHTTMNLIRNICRKEAFDPENLKQCDPDKYFAPDNYQPKGSGSDSIGSYYFTYLCPNVGYGLDNEV